LQPNTVARLRTRITNPDEFTQQLKRFYSAQDKRFEEPCHIIKKFAILA